MKFSARNTSSLEQLSVVGHKHKERS